MKTDVPNVTHTQKNVKSVVRRQALTLKPLVALVCTLLFVQLFTLRESGRCMTWGLFHG